eukprot:CAMPEP_0197525704 /NCGR_PEP_ID=MMETSP1318-20131121/14004_1 /TAXON_ID=552666 /ORGANISM="Partenskyella glossopodia, Strain RCC365" /LENGTH=397 /DNA_ID=CAMNT_0043079397 /DNA_START=124 /DNA_END=1317 /DNA_ORIENTATION=+
MPAGGRPHTIHPRCPTDDDPYLHPHALPFSERVGPALIMTMPPMASLFLGWFLNSIKSHCTEGGAGSDLAGSILRRLSAGLLLGVVCTEIVPVMVLELHNDPPSFLLAPLIGVLISILVVRAVDLFGGDHEEADGGHVPKHKLSLHLMDESPRSRYSSGGALRKGGGYGSTSGVPATHTNGTTTSASNGKEVEMGLGAVESAKKATSDGRAAAAAAATRDAYLPLHKGSASGPNSACLNSLGPALKLLVNCVLDGLVLGTSLVENFDSTGWSLSAAVTLETCVLGMSFSAGTVGSSTPQKFCLNLIIASGFPVGVIMGLILTKEFQFNTFFFLAIMGFTTGILMDIVLEDLMREVYIAESNQYRGKPKLYRMGMETIKTLAFYAGFMWCLVSETQLP